MKKMMYLALITLSLSYSSFGVAAIVMKTSVSDYRDSIPGTVTGISYKSADAVEIFINTSQNSPLSGLFVSVQLTGDEAKLFHHPMLKVGARIELVNWHVGQALSIRFVADAPNQ